MLKLSGVQGVTRDEKHLYHHFQTDIFCSGSLRDFYQSCFNFRVDFVIYRLIFPLSFEIVHDWGACPRDDQLTTPTKQTLTVLTLTT